MATSVVGLPPKQLSNFVSPVEIERTLPNSCPMIALSGTKAMFINVAVVFPTVAPVTFQLK